MTNIFLDCETTGLNPKIHKALSIAIIITDPNLETVFEKEYLITATGEDVINPVAMKINGINIKNHNRIASSEHIAASKINFDIMKILNQRKRLTQDNFVKIIGHNIDFDLKFIGEIMRRNYMYRPWDGIIIDTCAMAKEMNQSGKIKLKNHKLKTVCEFFRYTENSYHNAIDDVKATIFIYDNMRIIQNSMKKTIV